ncbi:MAG: hypothetical protein U0L17_01315 [Acutalibacteraceae bacterium]|nr:hypothetical protein [Acutalibacteraceae bacterium]
MAEFLNYKGRPLVRCGDTLYYGNMEDKFVIQLTIKDKEPDGDITSAKKILVQLLDTDTSVDPVKRIIKKSEKEGLYNAMDIGAIWLERALAEK